VEELCEWLAQRDVLIDALSAELDAARVRLAELEARLGQTLRNSSKPPSPDGLTELATPTVKSAPPGPSPRTSWPSTRPPTPRPGRRRADTVIEQALACPVPETQHLAKTLATWRTELLAYFDTDGTFNGPTEAVNLLIETSRRTGHGLVPRQILWVTESVGIMQVSRW